MDTTTLFQCVMNLYELYDYLNTWTRFNFFILSVIMLALFIIFMGTQFFK